jgi:hypothetical protein
MTTIKRVATKDLKVGDVVQWTGVESNVYGAIHSIEEHGEGGRTIRIEPIGSNARTLNPDDKVDVVLPRTGMGDDPYLHGSPREGMSRTLIVPGLFNKPPR